MDSPTGQVLVCSETLAERRKLLGRFSRQGVPVYLCATPEFTIEALDNGTALVVVNLFDCEWPAERWGNAIAKKTDKVPVLFVYDPGTDNAASVPDDVDTDIATPPQLHLTEREFHSLADAGVSDLRARVFSTWVAT